MDNRCMLYPSHALLNAVVIVAFLLRSYVLSVCGDYLISSSTSHRDFITYFYSSFCNFLYL